MKNSNVSIRIIDQKRAVLSIIITALALLIVLNLLFPTKTVTGFEHPSYIIYTVEEGDTVWSIAEKYNTDHKDIREIVYEINKANHKNNNEFIFTGETIKIPLS